MLMHLSAAWQLESPLRPRIILPQVSHALLKPKMSKLAGRMYVFTLRHAGHRFHESAHPRQRNGVRGSLGIAYPRRAQRSVPNDRHDNRTRFDRPVGHEESRYLDTSRSYTTFCAMSLPPRLRPARVISHLHRADVDVELVGFFKVRHHRAVRP